MHEKKVTYREAWYEAQNIFRPTINQISRIYTPRSRTKIELPAR